MSIYRVFLPPLGRGISSKAEATLALHPDDPLTKLAGTIHETSRPHKLHFSPAIAQIVSVVQVHSALTKTELMGGKC